jgi:hypothetical protein
VKIGDIEVQGVRRVHIEDMTDHTDTTWDRVPEHRTHYGETRFFWRATRTGTAESECVKVSRKVPDEIILNLIRWVFKNHANGYNPRIKGDTVYVKISGCADKRKSAIWNWVIF